MYLNQSDIVARHYQIVRVLGRGGFGITYLAKDIRDRNKPIYVALKQLVISQNNDRGEVREHQYIQNLEREANTLRNLRHDCIPKFIDKFCERDRFYIVQEYIEGDSLQPEIIPGRQTNEQEIITFLRNTLHILKFIHRKRIIHRDLKPANLIRRKSDRKIFLIDFGAVKEIATLQHNSSGNSLTKVVGTSGYMPVEQAVGNPQFNSDIYALGIIALQMITDFSIHDIYDSDSEPITDDRCNYIWQHEAYGHISEGFKNIVSQMIQYNFKERYQSARELLQDLDKLETGKKITINNNQIVFNQENVSQIYNIDSLESPKRFPNQTLIIDNNENLAPKNTKNIVKRKRVLVPTLIIFLLMLIGGGYWIYRLRSDTCNVAVKDYISCGEEILSPTSKDINRQRGVEYFSNNQYDRALRYFNRSWKVSREAETLIYLNNTLLEAIDAEYYTLAVAVPLSYQGITPKNHQLAQDFLRGVAYAQTQVNLNLLDSNSETKYSLPGQDFLPRKVISSGQKPKGLRIVIVDDRNEPNHTKLLAKNIANKSDIFGVIGHYASNISLAAVDEYQAENLSQISFGTTTIDLTENPKSNFFRVVYTNNEEAQVIIDAIDRLEIADKKIAVFYNPSSTYSTDFLQAIEKRINDYNQAQVSPEQKIKVVKEFNLADKQNFKTNLALQTTRDLDTNIILLLPDGQISNSKALEHAIEVIKESKNNIAIIGGNPLINSQVEALDNNNNLNLTLSTFWNYLSEPEAKFVKNTQKLWNIERIYPGTATAYDATLVLIEAIRQQTKPTRKGTLETISAPGFFVRGSTGDITFNTPNNGDRKNFAATTVKLVDCGDYNVFIPLKNLDRDISDLTCN